MNRSRTNLLLSSVVERVLEYLRQTGQRVPTRKKRKKGLSGKVLLLQEKKIAKPRMKMKRRRRQTSLKSSSSPTSSRCS
jgi:hypothetical protein